MIIGAEIFWDIMRGNERTLIPNQLFMIDTELGWVVYGKCDSIRPDQQISVVCSV
jgi:hypothetical protein